MADRLDLLKLGRGTYVSESINIMSWKDDYLVRVGRYCSIAKDCTFLLAANHRIDWVTTSTLIEGLVSKELEEHLHEIGHNQCKGDIVIGNDVWIGTQAMILPGVHIGDGAVITARSVVTKDVEPYSVVGGYPAKLMYYRFPENIIDKLLEIKWWDWPEELVRQSSSLLWNSDIQKFIDYAKALGQIMPIELLNISENGTKAFIRNNTSNVIKVNTKFTDAVTDESLGTIPLEMTPDLEYWVTAPTDSKTRHFMVVEAGTTKILVKAKTH